MNDLEALPGLLELCWKYILLGVVQGLTEFLPISSTAHLKVLPLLAGWGDPGVSVTAVIQLGSIIAVVFYFRRDLKCLLMGLSKGLLSQNWREADSKLGLAIFIGTIPILFAGMGVKFFWDGYENSVLRSIPSIAIASIFMAGLLAIAERQGRRIKSINEIQGIDGLVIGLGQVLALIPGVSRSGITLTTALLAGCRREDAARFSFLLGVPSITLAGIVQLKDAFRFNSIYELLPLSLGILSATLVSWFAIDWLLKFLQRNNAWVFVFYRLVFGIVLIILWVHHL